MTLVQNNINVYLYGVEPSPSPNPDNLTIYVTPAIFTKVALSSLEGFFVQEDGLPREIDLKWFIPRVSFKREYMEKAEKHYRGRFVPFKKL